MDIVDAVNRQTEKPRANTYVVVLYCEHSSTTKTSTLKFPIWFYHCVSSSDKRFFF